MELKWLEDFVSLAKAGSFSKASFERNVTQPAFSRRIRALEHWLGVTLVDRSSYPVSLTPHGEKFLPYAQEMLRTTYGIRDDFRLITAQQANAIKIVSLHSLSIYFLPEIIDRILGIHDDTRAEVIPSIQGVDQHFDALANGIAQLLVTYWHDSMGLNLVNYQELEEKQVGVDQMIPVVSTKFAQTHDLTSLEKRGSRIPFLAYSSFSFSDKIVSPKAKMFGDRLKVVYENSLSESLKGMVLRDRGLAWLPIRSVAQELERGEVVVVGGAEHTIDLQIMVYRHKESNSRLVDEVWALL